MLHIAHNRITDEGAKAFANSKFSQLDRLEIADNLLSDEGFEILGESFATGELSKVHYTIVDSFHFSCHDLRNSSNTLRVGGAIDRLNLAGVSDQGHRHIKGGRISDNDMLFFAQFLIVPKRLRKLDLLFLHTNIIGAGGCAALASAMRAGTSEGLTNLGQLHLTTIRSATWASNSSRGRSSTIKRCQSYVSCTWADATLYGSRAPTRSARVGCHP